LKSSNINQLFRCMSQSDQLKPIKIRISYLSKNQGCQSQGFTDSGQHRPRN
jgi:hypothetical protein